MSWLSKALGININVRKLVPPAVSAYAVQRAWAKLFAELSDHELRELSIALDTEWVSRKAKVGQ